MTNLEGEEAVDELKLQWKRLWHDRIDDKLRAEGVANQDYSMLFVEKGTVIFATRNFRMPSIAEIMQRHGISNLHRIIPPDPHTGGWGKFVKTNISGQKPHRKSSRREQYDSFAGEKQKQQLKKGGRGWLHV